MNSTEHPDPEKSLRDDLATSSSSSSSSDRKPDPDRKDEYSRNAVMKDGPSTRVLDVLRRVQSREYREMAGLQDNRNNLRP